MNMESHRKSPIYIGWDSREDEAFRVLRYSIKKHCPSADVHAIVQSDLRREGIYSREPDPQESTEFSLTRFLTPYLMNYSGWALFMDCDMLVTANIHELFNYADLHSAVQVVKHFHQPIEKTKMDGQVQTLYPRKNWSSVMLFNCGHIKNKNLTPEVVSSVQPSFLHRFQWLEESDVGELPLSWNFLSEYYKKLPSDVTPKNIHFTSGSPFMAGYEDCDYSEVWYKYRDEMNELVKG